MPKVKQYTKGFDLNEGMNLAGYMLIKMDIKHLQKIRYKEYTYPTILTWKKISSDASTYNLLKKISSDASTYDLLKKLEEYLHGDRVIYTTYGNPYKCNFGVLEVNEFSGDIVIISSIGNCRRI